VAGGLGDDISRVVATLAELYEVQGDARVARMLRQSEFELDQTDYDNWNGGTYTYSLSLKIAPRVFAELGDSISSLEEQLLERLKLMTRVYANEYLGSVIITPSLDVSSSSGQGAPALQEPAFWRPGYFKLFITHISAHKMVATEIARGLEEYGISGFVAHEDIEPTKEWEHEIILALNTMDALAALLTPGFESSKWTGQEVGVAIGRGALVVPLRMGLDPYGFIGRSQGLAAGGKEPARIATEIAQVLAAHQQTRLKMAHAVVTAFEESKSFSEAKVRASRLALVTVLPKPLRDRVRAAMQSNLQIKDAWGVPQRVESVLARFE
jgi:hypothetical protein